MPKKATETIVDLVRLNALSDGVFAIALTLLVLDIRIPENTSGSDLSASLVALAPKLLIYLISFIAIGGATVILLFGLLMFMASLGPARPF